MSVVYLNDQFLPSYKASIPISDRGFLFGDGVFTTLKVEEGHIHDISQHLTRLSLHCDQLNIRPPELSESVLYELVDRNSAHHGLWRMKLIVTGGDLPDLALPLRDHGNILVMMKKVAPVSDKPLVLEIFPSPIISPLSPIKTLSYLQRLHVKQFAIDRGVDDALVCSEEGIILESAFSNVFWITNGQFFTPSASQPLLQGITLQKNIEAAQQKELDIQEGEYTLEDIPEDARVFLCNAISNHCPVEKIGDRFFTVQNILV
jgi:4-amino-4-deoxychorismate lyase